MDKEDELVEFLLRNLRTADFKIQKQQEDYIRHLIQKDYQPKYMSDKQLQLLAQYISNYVIENRNIQTHVKIAELEENVLGQYDGDTITIDKNKFSDIAKFIETVCHETQHAIQDFEINNNKSKIGFDYAVDAVIRNYYKNHHSGFNTYDKNYRVNYIEYNAQDEGFRNARTLLSMFGFKDKSSKLHKEWEEEKKRKEFEYDIRERHDGKKFPTETFIFHTLSTAIKKNPSYLRGYPTLLTLYEYNGNPKSFEKIISREFKSNEHDKSSILDGVCKYYIHEGELQKLDIGKFSPEIQANIASRLINILIKEQSQISKMGHGTGNITPASKMLVEEFHLKNSLSIMTFVNKNYQLFKSLQEQGKFSSIIDMTYYDSTIDVFEYGRIYEGLEHSNQRPDRINLLVDAAKKGKQEKVAYRESKKLKPLNLFLQDARKTAQEYATTDGMRQAVNHIRSNIEQDISVDAEEDKNR